MSNNLMPCPIRSCSGKAAIERRKKSLVVYCTKCGLSTADEYYISGDEHINLWNNGKRY